MQLGARNSIPVSHVGSREPSTAATTRCLPGCVLAGSWNQKWSWNGNAGTVIWDVHVPSSVSVTTASSTFLLLLTLCLEEETRKVFHWDLDTPFSIQVQSFPSPHVININELKCLYCTKHFYIPRQHAFIAPFQQCTEPKLFWHKPLSSLASCGSETRSAICQTNQYNLW